MKQLINVGGELVVEDIPAPLCEDTHVLVNNVYSLISAGTEISTIGNKSGIKAMASMVINNNELINKGIELVRNKGLKDAMKIIREQTDDLIVPLGYSSSGIVLEVGNNVTDIAVGDKVACAGAGYANHAEIVSIPRNLIAKIPEYVSFEEAAFTTVGSIAIQGIRRAKVVFGDNVVVIGLGLIGLITCQILKAAGARVIGIDIISDRLKLAEELGVDECIISDEMTVGKLKEYTEQTGADSVIICAATASNVLVNQAMEMVRKKGTVVVVGDVGMNINRSPFYEKEIDFLISCSYGPGRYDRNYEEKAIDYPIGYVRWTENRNMKEFLKMVSEKKINVKKLIYNEFFLEESIKAYDSFNYPDKPVGILFKYKKIDDHVNRKIQLKSSSKKDKINVAIIGAGGFAKVFHLPNIVKIPYYNLKAVVSRTGVNAKKIAEEYDADYYTTDFNDVMNDKEVDMIIISTRHNLHAPLILEAARHKKDIFVEKPFAMNYEDCELIYNSIMENNVNLVIGFNRRMSTFGQKTRKLLYNRKNPLLITYRINSPSMNKDHWINDPVEGGGAIIGECCHFFDFCNWIVGYEPKRLYAEMISSNNESIIDNNNVISTIKYNDGSLASIIYNTIGNESFSKERIEIFCDGITISINDFKEIEILGFNKKSMKLNKINKGHFELINEYGKLILSKNSSNDIPTVEDGVKATLCSLKILKALKTGEIQKWKE
jgi:predicted dehydrogenase/threonine dehydrogenase-like Zn-dependent dehydrogenase